MYLLSPLINSVRYQFSNMRLQNQRGQTPHRARHYFLCSVTNAKKYVRTLFQATVSVELAILKKARVRSTASDLPAKARETFYKKTFPNLLKTKILHVLRIGKRRAGLVTGQILVETMVALAMVVIGLLGFLSLLSYSIGLNKVVADQYVASYLASEGIEIIKNIIDTDVAGGSNSFNTTVNQGNCGDNGCQVDYNSVALLSYDGKTLKFDNETKRYTYSANNYSDTPFVRKIIVTQNDPRDGLNEMTVQSIVRWTTRGGIQNIVTLEDHFYNWRP